MIVLANGPHGVQPLRLNQQNTRAVVARNHRRHEARKGFIAFNVAQDGALWRIELGRAKAIGA